MRISGTFNSKYIHTNKRIAEALSQIEDSQITVVSSPSGYGKSTLVKKYIEDKKYSYIWMSTLDTRSYEIWTSFCLAVQKLDKQLYKSMLAIGIPDSPPKLETIYNLLDRYSCETSLILVIDDFDNTDSKNNNFINYLKNLPLKIKIVILTRNSTIKNVNNFLDPFFMNFITINDLAFTRDDISEYFKHCGIELTNEDIDWLYNYSEGWPALLEVLAVSFHKTHTFSKTQDIIQLLLQDFSQPCIEKMIRLSFLEEFDYDIVSSLFENITEEKFLEIAKNNSLIIYSPKDNKYRFHNVLSTDLLRRFELLPHNEKINLYTKAGLIYKRKNEFYKAISLFTKSRDCENIFQILEIMNCDGLYKEHIFKMFPYVENCEKAIWMRHPKILLIYIVATIIANEKSKTEFAVSIFDYMIESGSIYEFDNSYILLRDFVIACSCYECDIFKREQYLRKALDYHNKSENKFNTYISRMEWRISGVSPLSTSYTQNINISNFITPFNNISSVFSEINGTFAGGMADATFAELYYLQGFFDESISKSYCALTKSKINLYHKIVIITRFHLAKAHICCGDQSEFQNCIDKIKDQRSTTDNAEINKLCDTVITYFDCILEKSSSVKHTKLIESLNASDIMMNASFYAVCHFLNLLSKRKYRQIILLEESVIPFFNNYSYVTKIYLYIILARAFNKSNKPQSAEDRLKKALSMAYDNKIIMPFAELCDDILPLLAKICSKDFYNLVIIKHLQFSDGVQKIKKHVNKGTFKGLTMREYEIALHAASGLTYDEIAQKLYISINTVKTILQSVYKKLNINSRKELRNMFDQPSPYL